MQHPKILLQLDSDSLTSTFDSVVAIDAGVEHLLQYANIEPTNVLPIVHGAIFTRGPKQLHNTAIFVGGSNVNVGEAIAAKIRQAFFGPMQVSVMLDGNGSNTTAAAAVLSAGRHLDWESIDALVLGGTGPVGKRVAKLLYEKGAKVRLASRDISRARHTQQQILAESSTDRPDNLCNFSTAGRFELDSHLAEVNVVFGCGAAGVELLSAEQLNKSDSVQVAIDLNAVPPAGLGGIQATDKAVDRDGRIDYGAIGVGGLKMKIHRKAIQSLFTQNDLFLDTDGIFAIGEELETAKSMAK